jgi:hypothetical protein
LIFVVGMRRKGEMEEWRKCRKKNENVEQGRKRKQNEKEK